ncbi:hypothetical protein [Vagococcus fluvialis]|uniref:hypothetical protein n=1 Tax=Vagococcus fluvialis TaxID=2738 RepID=UPI00378FD20B
MFALDIDFVAQTENKAILYGKSNAIDIEGVNNYFHLLCNLFYYYYTERKNLKAKKILDMLNTEKLLYQEQLIGRHVIFICYYNCLYRSFSNKSAATGDIEVLLEGVKKFEFHKIHEQLYLDSRKLRK